jgi:hypothetical protein
MRGVNAFVIGQDTLGEVLAYHRFLAIDRFDTFLKYENKSKKLPVNATRLVTLEHEAHVLQSLQEFLRRCMSHYETTIEEDKRLLASLTLTFNQRNMVVLRMKEKQVSQYNIQDPARSYGFAGANARNATNAHLRKNHFNQQKL